MSRRTLFLSVLVIPPVLIVSYLRHHYPLLQETSLPRQSQFRAILADPPRGVRYPCVDVFETTVSKSEFTTDDYAREVSYHLWTSFLIKTEAFLFGSKPLPTSPTSITEGTKIANIVVCKSILRPSYLFQFEIPKWLVAPVDYVADRGGPWRMLRGGYQEIVAVEEGEKVHVWYNIVHEYGENDGKIWPWIGNWAHRMYARALLDVAVRKLRNSARQKRL